MDHAANPAGRWRRPRRVIALGVAGTVVIVVALIVTAGLVLAGRPDSTIVARTVAAHRPGAAESAPAPARPILFVGASYTRGIGATPETEGYAYVTGRELHRPFVVDGQPGTGFVNPGPDHQGVFARPMAGVRVS